MFLEYYNLLEQPFGVTPDTRFLYLNHMYREALASLWCGIKEGRGFMALVAPPGMGKTTLLFQLLQRLRNSSARTVFLFQTCCTSLDLIRYLLQDLDIRPASDLASMHRQLNQTLLREARAGKQFVFVIDEAQNLSPSVLETVRLLSDFETSQGKLLQIILAGQPQLISTLMRPEMLQLTQRISVTSFLDPLNAAEVAQYIRHRLGVAGYGGEPLFTRDALQLVAQESRGIPRNINNICFGALSTALALGQRKIDRKIVEEVAADQNLRALGGRVRPSPCQATPPERRSAVDVTTTPVPRHTLRSVSFPSWFGRSSRHAAYLLIVLGLLAIPTSRATRVRPELRAQVFAKSKPTTDSKTLSLDAVAATRKASAETMRPAIESLSPAALPKDGFVVVEPQQTLRQISLRYLGRYSLRLAQQIQALNPGLDPNHIEVGQRVRLADRLQDSTQLSPDNNKHARIVALIK
jgi:general secretion pathway protein A